MAAIEAERFREIQSCICTCARLNDAMRSNPSVAGPETFQAIGVRLSHCAGSVPFSLLLLKSIVVAVRSSWRFQGTVPFSALPGRRSVNVGGVATVAEARSLQVMPVHAPADARRPAGPPYDWHGWRLAERFQLARAPRFGSSCSLMSLRM